jgi:hypothetical protein
MKILNVFYSTVMSSYKPKEEIDMVCFLVDKFNIPIEEVPLGIYEIEKMYKKYYFLDYCNRYGLTHLIGLNRLIHYCNSNI